MVRVGRNLLALALGWVQRLAVKPVAGSNPLASVSRSWSSSALGLRLWAVLVTRTWLGRDSTSNLLRCPQVGEEQHSSADWYYVSLYVNVSCCPRAVQVAVGLTGPVKRGGGFVNAAW